MLSLTSADALLAPLAEETALLLAVSGGPDSIALMLLAAAWSLRARVRIVVATVDHGLRAASREEALFVGGEAQALGFEHRLLLWAGEKPSTRLQERAREMRYALLADCAAEIDPRCAIVTAHHADDQAETILFRLCRGSGGAGLAGMSAVSTLLVHSARSQRASKSVRLLRPLLEAPKAALEAICAEAGRAYVTDPSNLDPRFARGRLRSLAATLAAEGLDRDALLRLGRRAARAEAALRHCAAEVEAGARIEGDAAPARFKAEALRGAPDELLMRLIERQVAHFGLAPRLDRLERASQRVAGALARREAARMTLAGALIDVDEDFLSFRPAPPRSRHM
ncbi:tRNA lysidine(34) synthetase TilS [Methylocystis bryophila]|uniref:tRNA(Ile)-lysidine synthase n=1 Tax=Methylocystis bryophila TaxID=655015 RepID=A0A1W6MW16_9HYPH|nr:tRNA lysidine(34) synthetase TilS [Methylocystis bryophila]ARN81772.1 tRNA lysidine(34) synthetase TilS [Methylocystis bryophila]BDV37831.1 tRNA(Ile)-lysidine synthase [Methylocystis bryophila]